MPKCKDCAHQLLVLVPGMYDPSKELTDKQMLDLFPQRSVQTVDEMRQELYSTPQQFRAVCCPITKMLVDISVERNCGCFEPKPAERRNDGHQSANQNP